MESRADILVPTAPKRLRDYLPLCMGFFLALFAIGLFQQVSFYAQGILDQLFTASLFALWLNQLGFASVTGLVLAFVFKYFEKRKAGQGVGVTKLLFAVLVVLEAMLTAYYVAHLEPFDLASPAPSFGPYGVFLLLGAVLVGLGTFYGSQRYLGNLYRVINGMYPVTLILFSLFLATLFSNKRPINQNKTQHMAHHLGQAVFSVAPYSGTEEYPLLQDWNLTAPTAHFAFKDTLPNVTIIIVEGLGASVMEGAGPYAKVMPFLNGLRKEALYWPNMLSNATMDGTAVPGILGSLPFGESGFTHLSQYVHRNTLYGIMAANGYGTSFAYGGNMGLHGLDRFIKEEGVDLVLDKHRVTMEQAQLPPDAAGTSVGYPVGALFETYGRRALADAPAFDVLYSRIPNGPYAIPQKGEYVQRVKQLLADSAHGHDGDAFAKERPEVLASYVYLDDALRKFMDKERSRSGYENTLYLVVGGRPNVDFPLDGALGAYRVPLLIHCPLVKKAQEFKTVGSHADIAPTITGVLASSFPLALPNKAAWVGRDLFQKGTKGIPLWDGKGRIRDFLAGRFLLSNGELMELDQNLLAAPANRPEKEREMKSKLKEFMAINHYVTKKDKLLPASMALVENDVYPLTKEQRLWVEARLATDDFDKAYVLARDLAQDGKWERAKTLCHHILNYLPRNADTEILLGRIHGWQKEYDRSIAILENSIQKYPRNKEAYGALLDTYYWAGANDRAVGVLERTTALGLSGGALTAKLERSLELSAQDANPKGNNTRQWDGNRFTIKEDR
ncbi:sulfatase-like hydrolase/transferase [Maribacter sp. 2307ULW6-5]|uniref:sulfatase-like hydrolase/transferase n=1 Tax=Maribacter sp. 2307ULW6-5 TaxID=3386275 RepID=UPI0039BC9C74